MDDRQKIYAVLTGDLIKSSRLTSDQSRGAIERLKKTADDFSKLYSNAVIGRMDSFRHDSWQLLLGHPFLSLRAAVFLRASLKLKSDAQTKYDTRISIGIGTVESISKRRISDSRGPAFTSSGKEMDSMNGRHLAFSIGGNTSVFEEAIGYGIIPLIDCVIDDWTPTESQAVYGALKGWTQEEIANHWLHEKNGKKPSRQAVGDSLNRAHWSRVGAVMLWVETAIKQVYGLA